MTVTDETKLGPDEIRRRLPEVEFIEQSDQRERAIEALQRGVPEYFWSVPATSTALHNPLSRDTHGLWIHTKMVVGAYERLAETFFEQGRINEKEADFGRVACLLHDIRKYGDEYTPGSSAAKDHDLQAAAWVRANTEFDDQVAEAIASHMGPWYEGPKPETELQHLVHEADMLGSHRFGTIWLYKPAVELVERYPDVEQYDDRSLPWE